LPNFVLFYIFDEDLSILLY